VTTTGSVVVTIWYKPDGDRAVPFTQTVKIVRVPPVGGFSIVIPVDKSALLSPYIGLYSTILVAAVATAVCVKRAKDGKEKR
jgi:hypothetical protein